MKKIIILFSLLVAAATVTAQSWATYYNTTPLDSVTGNNQLLFIVEDADSTHVLYFSTLESIFEGQLNNEAGLYSALSDVTQFIEEGDNATLLNGTAYRLLYVDASGDVTELTLGADGTYLMSNGEAAVPTWATPAGTGDLLSTNNLSDVSDPATALSNLGGLPDEDTVQVNFSAGLDTVTSAGVLTVTWDSAAVYDYIDTEVAGAGGGSAELDSTDLAFKGEIYPIHTFTQGTGHSSSYSLASGMMLTPFFNRSGDTLVVTSFVNSMYADSQSEDTVQIQILYNDTLGNVGSEAVAIMEGSPMDIVTDVNGYFGRVEHTTIVNDTIPPDVWVWGRIVETTSGANSMVASTMSGYKVKGTFNSNPFDSDVTAPLYSSSELGTYNDTIILVLFDTTDVDQSSVPAVSAFSFYGGDTEIGLNAVTMNEDSLFIALDSALTVFNDSTLYLSYTVPGTNPLQDSSGNQVVAWVDSTVTNNLGSGEPVANYISNGTFDSGTGWEFSTANWSIGSGVASYDDLASSYIYQTQDNMTTAIESSTYYYLTFDITSTGTGAIRIFNSAYAVQYYAETSYSNGSHDIGFKTPADIGVGGLSFRASSSGSTAAFDLDNVVLIPAPNYATDGDFSSATNWSLGTGWSIQGDSALFTTGSSGFISQVSADMDQPIIANKTYVFLFDISISSGSAVISFYSSDEVTQYSTGGSYGSGTHEVEITMPADIGTGGISFRSSSTSDNNYGLDNIKIYKQGKN